MRISDWSSDVCSSDLRPREHKSHGSGGDFIEAQSFPIFCRRKQAENVVGASGRQAIIDLRLDIGTNFREGLYASPRSEEHTSELQSLMRISYAVFCLKKKTLSHEE